MDLGRIIPTSIIECNVMSVSLQNIWKVLHVYLISICKIVVHRKYEQAQFFHSIFLPPACSIIQKYIKELGMAPF
jgi:hypothetical protein